MAKTIFVTSFHPLISRNILGCGILENLEKDFRIIILAPDFKKDYFEKEFGSGQVIVEGINTALTRGDMFFRKLALVLSDTEALHIKRRSQFFKDKKFFSYFWYSVLNKILGGSKFFLKLVRVCDYKFFRTDFYGELFKRYEPSLIFSTDLQNELDVRLIKESKRRIIRTIGMVRSWDNLSSKGILRILPDKILVHNEIIKNEAVKYNLMPAEKIAVIGVPHYGNYIKIKFGAKEDFFSRFGFDSSKKLILFSPIGDRYIRNNILDKLVLENISSLDANILVRLPPTDTVNFEGFKSRKANIYFQNTGAGTWKGGTKLHEISRGDDMVLAESLFFCDLVVTGQSTIVIDASVFNKPVIVIYFDSEPRVYWDSIRRYYDYEYYGPVLKSGGIKLAGNTGDLISMAKEYLENPGLDNAGRNIIAKEQTGLNYGQSAGRLEKEIRLFL